MRQIELTQAVKVSGLLPINHLPGTVLQIAKDSTLKAKDGIRVHCPLGGTFTLRPDQYRRTINATVQKAYDAYRRAEQKTLDYPSSNAVPQRVWDRVHKACAAYVEAVRNDLRAKVAR